MYVITIYKYMDSSSSISHICVSIFHHHLYIVLTYTGPLSVHKNLLVQPMLHISIPFICERVIQRTVISLINPVWNTNQWMDNQGPRSGQTRGGIRCLGGVGIPCWPVTPAVSPTSNVIISSQNQCFQIRQTEQSAIKISASSLGDGKNPH
jgi:hypothetical protein